MGSGTHSHKHQVIFITKSNRDTNHIEFEGETEIQSISVYKIKIITN